MDRRKKRRIALFGGTFDPVHEGHLFLADRARRELALDEVRFLPCRLSPHKTGSAPTSAEHRLEMLRLATDGLPWAVVDDFELRRPPPSFSYETAEAMAAEFPDAELFWIMGGDQWDALPAWKHPERLAAAVSFVVLARGGVPQPRPGYRLHVIPGDHPASATAIRAALGKNDGAEIPWLPEPVAAYARRQRLYETG